MERGWIRRDGKRESERESEIVRDIEGDGQGYGCREGAEEYWERRRYRGRGREIEGCRGRYVGREMDID